MSYAFAETLIGTHLSWKKCLMSIDGVNRFAIDDDSYLVISGDSGSSWQEFFGGSIDDFAIDKTGQYVLLISEGALYLSTDYGEAFDEIVTWPGYGEPTYALKKVAINGDKTELFIGFSISGGDYVWFSSSDDGATWDFLTLPGTGNSVGLVVNDDSTVIIVQQLVNIYKTLNNGADWTLIYEADEYGMSLDTMISASNDGLIILIAEVDRYYPEYYKIVLSTNGGDTWSEETFSPSPYFARVVKVSHDGSRCFFLGSDYMYDRTSSWQSVSLPVVITDPPPEYFWVWKCVDCSEDGKLVLVGLRAEMGEK